MTRPNVILFISHDTGRFVSPYGYSTVDTPNCERLAREGVMFTQSYCTSPLCSPSRAALVTGRFPHQNGVMGLTGPLTGGFDLYPEERHASALFRDAGYQTVLCGFEHETPHWQRVGFDTSISGPGGWYNGGGDLRDHAGEMDHWFASREKNSPFYMQIGCHETHRGWTKFDTPPDDSKGIWQPPFLSDHPDVEREMAEQQGACKRLDDCLGQILDVVDKHQLRDDTIFVFTSDHGVDFPRAKGTFYDPGIGVFHFMRWPGGNWGSGRVCDSMISNVDILPTLLEACGIPVPKNSSGRSFLPLLNGGDYRPNEAVFAEKIYHDTYDPTRCVRTERYKYIRYFEACIFQDLRLATMTQQHYWPSQELWRRRTVEELYDLQADPDEMNNLAEDQAHAEVLAEMRKRLLTWMQDTDDPQLNGPIPSPYYQQQLEELKRTL